MTTNKLFLLSAVAIFLCSGCRNNIEHAETQETKNPIRWQVSSETSRSLIGSDTQLQSACADGAEAIAIWGDYIHEGSVYHAFVNTPLQYMSTTPKRWDYSDYDRYWMKDAQYRFRVFYPMKALAAKTSATDASSISIEYDTNQFQEDLLVGYTEVNSSTWDMTQPVPLNMMHALAALKFEFKMEDGSKKTKLLSKFSLDNRLCTSGELQFNRQKVEVTDWKNLDSSPSSEIYKWQNSGIAFSATSLATAYSSPAGTSTSVGNDFCGSDGFVFIIPQQCSSAPVIHFTTGDTDYSVGIGATLFEPGKRYVYTINIKDNDKVEMTLRIKEWNKKDSSYIITF